jgi:3-deoxy-D-manno-octulosonic-acid transferase
LYGTHLCRYIFLGCGAKIGKYALDKRLPLLLSPPFNLFSLIFLYNLFILLFQLGVRIASIWNGKAKQWRDGRRKLFTELEASFPLKQPLIWVHTASAGEFEQAKPVIEAMKNQHPNLKILVTFFSPSGNSVGKKWPLADYVTYLPIDTKVNAERFLQLVQPQLVVFVKYDFWYHHLKAVHQRGIPLILISAIFRKNQAFFKWYSGFYLKMLHFFNHLFVQDAASVDLLQQHGITNSSVAGDTRFDRVAAIAQKFTPITFLNSFVGNRKVLVAGSTWPDDERMLAQACNNFTDLKLIIAPHEINKEHIQAIEQLFPNSVKYSELQAATANQTEAQQRVLKKLENTPVLIIDNIGMLSRLYHYATVTYIGGGFTKSGIHNTLEAAVYGKPVLFGPNYQKFREAKELITCGGAFSYTSEEQLRQLIKELMEEETQYKKASEEAFNYVQANKGATEKIMGYIQENRLLTS